MTKIDAANNTNFVKQVAFQGTQKMDTINAKSTTKQIKELSNLSLGKDLVVSTPTLKAGEVYNGLAFDVQAIGNNPIELTEVTPKNVDKFSKYIDIWYQGGKAHAEEEVKAGKPDLRFLHPKVGDSMQNYGIISLKDPYVTKDPEIINYARKNDLIVKDPKTGEEFFKNFYNGDKKIIESTYVDDAGKFLSETGGLKGTVKATQVKDTKAFLLPIGSKVIPLESSNPKIIGPGDVVCCAVKKGVSKMDYFVKSVSEFLKTAKMNSEKGNVDFIKDLQAYEKLGRKDAVEWGRILNKYAKIIK